MKLSTKQRKLLIRLLERFEAKINKPRAERWVDAQYEAHFLQFEVEEFHETMKLLKKGGLISFTIGNRRRADEGKQYDLNERSYWVLISDSGINLARKSRENEEEKTKRIVLPVWQIICAAIALIFSTVVSNYVGDMVNKTPDRQVKVLEAISNDLNGIRKILESSTKPSTQPSTNRSNSGNY